MSRDELPGDAAGAEPAPDEQPDPVPARRLSEPSDGVPPVVVDAAGLARAARTIAAAHGPVAVDAERASGYRYGQRAYLVQLRRAGAGTWLVDPVAVPDLAPLAEALAGTEWVLHAATQDLPCLAEVGLAPTRLFDTELGARLAGLSRVGLSSALEHYLRVDLAKEHSAVDWSTRPLPQPWLRYAALDVECLVELRDAVAADLEEQGKREWAEQEFDALTRFVGPEHRPDPWRRASGMHRVRSRRVAATVRALWDARDRIARERDIAPGRVLPDATLVDLAVRAPRSAAALLGGTVESSRVKERRAQQGLQRYRAQWLQALAEARSLPEDALPDLGRGTDGPPPPRTWADRDPAAAARLAHARAAAQELSDRIRVPVENLLTPDVLRRLLWDPPAGPDGTADAATVDAALHALGARPWQRDLMTPVVVEAVRAHPGD